VGTAQIIREGIPPHLDLIDEAANRCLRRKLILSPKVHVAAYTTNNIPKRRRCSAVSQGCEGARTYFLIVLLLSSPGSGAVRTISRPGSRLVSVMPDGLPDAHARSCSSS
jgi:hypothetical protein